MILASLMSFLPALLAGSGGTADAGGGVRIMTVERQVILRVPVRPRQGVRIRWEEDQDLKCLPARAIAGVMLSGPDSIDFVLRNRRRVRARLDSDCPALDFYGSFYMQPEDNRICARRDIIRSREGGACRIEGFRHLVPKVEQ